MKQAVITGGNGTIGRAIADALEHPGWIVLTPTRSEMDVSDDLAVKTYFQRHPAGLLVCAAGSTQDALLPRISSSSWDEVLTVNFKGALACVRAVLPGMIQNGCGHIVFISSFSALHPPAGQAAYATAKAAILGLTADLARAHGPQNIRVNAILPGFMETRLTENVSTNRRDEIRNSHVLKRFNTPTQVGKFIRHLHHDLCHTSGQVFQLDSRGP